MKIILDNIIYSKVKNGGVSNYWFELSKYLINNTSDAISFFQHQEDLKNFHRNLLLIEKDHIIPLKNNLNGLSRLLPISYNSNDKFIYHSSYYRGLYNSKNKLEVTTVYDFIHSYYSSFIKKSIHNTLKFNAIRRSKGIICISKNTYNDLQKFCPLKSNQKAEVVYVGVSDDYFPIKDMQLNNISFIEILKIDKEFLLFVGGRTNYKNFDFVSAIMNDNKELMLVIVGGGILTEPEIKLFSKEAFSRIIYLGSIKNNELNLLLNHAFALIYPSSYEGFGIPVVEAMRAGCPVIGLNNATIKEVATNSALLLDSLSLQEFKNQKLKLKNIDFRLETINKGLEESQKYSWEKCSRETHEFYKDLYESSL